MKLAVIVLDEAEEELFDAYEWYESNRPGLGAEFREAIDAAMRRLVEGTAVSYAVPGVSSSSGVRRVFATRFPYSVVFMVRGAELWVLAFAHHSRRPGYWRQRTP